MEIKGAYTAKAAITSWRRDVDMDKSGKLKVSDSYQLTSAKSLSQTFMTICPTDITQSGKILFTLPDHQVVTLAYDAKVFSATKEKMQLDSPEEQGLKSSWDHQDIYRIQLVAKSPTAKATINYIVTK